MEPRSEERGKSRCSYRLIDNALSVVNRAVCEFGNIDAVVLH